MSDVSRTDVVVVGAGMGGLAAALALAGAGRRVVLIEGHHEVGGKLGVARVDGREIDAGPTVLTMRPVFEALFRRAGLELDALVRLRPLEQLARHAWPDGSTLDLFSDPERSAAAIAEFAGSAAADGFRRFTRYSAELLDSLEEPFLHHDNRGLFALMLRVGPRGLARLSQVDFGRSMWTALGDFFVDPRLRQLFARYATYYGSSPWAAPATLNLIAAVEQRGVWAVEGGMVALARAVAAAFVDAGGTLVTGRTVVRIVRTGRRVSAVVLDDGTRIDCGHVVFNGDPSRISDGHLGDEIRDAVPTIDSEPSFSAMTWSMVAVPTGLSLGYHTVCFSSDYAAEFDELHVHRRVPREPTVYVCAQDRLLGTPDGPERLFCLINAPAGTAEGEQESTCRIRMEQTLRACGVRLDAATPPVAMSPTDFARRFAGTGGALYGGATHGAMAPFRRHRSSTRIANLHLVGGAVHPGAGLPMVTLGGLAVAKRIDGELGSTPRATRRAASGGTAAASTTPVGTRSR